MLGYAVGTGSDLGTEVEASTVDDVEVEVGAGGTLREAVVTEAVAFAGGPAGAPSFATAGTAGLATPPPAASAAAAAARAAAFAALFANSPAVRRLDPSGR